MLAPGADTVSDYVYVEWGTHTDAGDVGGFYYHAFFSDSAGFGLTDGWNTSDSDAATTETGNGSMTISVGGGVWSEVTVGGWFNPSGSGGTFSTDDGAEYHDSFTGWGLGTSGQSDSEGSLNGYGDWSSSSWNNVTVHQYHGAGGPRAAGRGAGGAS